MPQSHSTPVNGVAAGSDVPGSTLLETSRELRRKVFAFLEENLEDGILKDVQSQVRISMGVVEEALRRYG